MIFFDEEDYRYFLATLGIVAQRDRWELVAYVCMGNHFHLCVQTIAPTISVGMHRFATRYVQWFNGRYGFEGHLFERRFHALLVERESHVLEIGRYLPLNPVRAGLCNRPEDWPWSSYAASIGRRPTPSFLDSNWLPRLFSDDIEAGRRLYAEFVDVGLRQLLRASLPPFGPRLA